MTALRVESRSRECRCWLFPGLVLAVAVFTAPSSDAAGITAFAQLASPTARAGSGFALAIPLVTEIISLEGELARSREYDFSPSLTLVTGSVVLTSPFELIRLRPYFVAGLGIYRQAKNIEKATSMATLQGFGLFVRLGGPLHARLDYRVLQLGGNPLQVKQKRVYAGLTLRF